jgi:hypothetical protein
MNLARLLVISTIIEFGSLMTPQAKIRADSHQLPLEHVHHYYNHKGYTKTQ